MQTYQNHLPISKFTDKSKYYLAPFKIALILILRMIKLKVSKGFIRLTLFYMGFWIYGNTWGGGQIDPPPAFS